MLNRGQCLAARGRARPRDRHGGCAVPGVEIDGQLPHMHLTVPRGIRDSLAHRNDQSRGRGVLMAGDRRLRDASRSGARRKGRATWSAGVAIVMVLVAITPADATYTSIGMPSKVWSVKYSGINDNWKSFYDNGRSRWNNAQLDSQNLGVNISVSSGAGSTATAGNYTTQSWYGRYTAYNTRAWRTFLIQVNAASLKAAAGDYYTTWVRSTITHEFGHGLSLDDNPSTSQASLMKHNRNRTTVGQPQLYDRQDVIDIYGW